MECARAILALNYRRGELQLSEHLLIEGQVGIKGLCGWMGQEQAECKGFSQYV